MNENKTVVCPKCAGLKFVFTGNYTINEESGEANQVNTPCDVCEGSGIMLEGLRNLYILNV